MRPCLDECEFKDQNGKTFYGKVYCKEEAGHKGFHMYQSRTDDAVRFIILWEHDSPEKA